MSVSRGLYRTPSRQLQFAGLWARGRLTRTTGRGYAQVLHPLQEHPHLPAVPIARLDSIPGTKALLLSRHDDWSKVTRLDTPVLRTMNPTLSERH